MKGWFERSEVRSASMAVAVIVAVASLALALVSAQATSEVVPNSLTAVRAESASGALSASRNAIVQAHLAVYVDQVSDVGEPLGGDAIAEARRVLDETATRMMEVKELTTEQPLATSLDRFQRSGRRALDLLDAGSVDAAGDEIRAGVEAEYLALESRLVAHRDGALAEVRTSVSQAGRVRITAQFLLIFVAPFAGMAVYRLLMVRDRQRRRLTEEVERQAFRIESHDRAISHLSHELRTPLTAINGLSLMLADELVPPDQLSEVANDIAEQSGVLGRRVDDLLLIAREETTGLVFTRELFEITNIVTGVVDEQRRFVGDVVEVNLDPCLVLVDRLRAMQLLRNLVVNAIDHGGGSCVIVGRQEGPWYRIEIADEGPGLGTVGDPFTAYFNTDDDPLLKGSLGMGLGAARVIADGLGGSIEYRDRGGGARFVVYFECAYNGDDSKFELVNELSVVDSEDNSHVVTAEAE